MTRPLQHGLGLNKYPLSQAELEAREERRREIREARKSAETFRAEGRTWRLVRLPDCYGADVPFEEADE